MCDPSEKNSLEKNPGHTKNSSKKNLEENPGCEPRLRTGEVSSLSPSDLSL